MDCVLREVVNQLDMLCIEFKQPVGVVYVERSDADKAQHVQTAV